VLLLAACHSGRPKPTTAAAAYRVKAAHEAQCRVRCGSSSSSAARTMPEARHQPRWRLTPRSLFCWAPKARRRVKRDSSSSSTTRSMPEARHRPRQRLTSHSLFWAPKARPHARQLFLLRRVPAPPASAPASTAAGSPWRQTQKQGQVLPLSPPCFACRLHADGGAASTSSSPTVVQCR
jgi:hypothetical protein